MRTSSWCILGLVVALAACDDSERSPIRPLDPSAVVPARGVAYEHLADGTMRPLAGLTLWVTGNTRSLDVLETTEILTDSNGVYAVSGLARRLLQVSVRPQQNYLSPCSSRVFGRTGDGDLVNVHVASTATFLANGIPFSMPPNQRLDLGTTALRGLVVEQTLAGNRPVAGASVEHFFRRDEAHPTGFTLTGDDGSYAVCAYTPDGLSGEDEIQFVRVRKAGYQTAVQQLGEWGSTRADFELVRE